MSVSSKAAEDKRHQILFEVADTGIGIPQDRINEIFEPFNQVERNTSRKREGVGLGLAISRQLVELMGGKIKAESVPGRGTTFSFTIQAEHSSRQTARILEKERRMHPLRVPPEGNLYGYSWLKTTR